MSDDIILLVMMEHFPNFCQSGQTEIVTSNNAERILDEHLQAVFDNSVFHSAVSSASGKPRKLKRLRKNSIFNNVQHILDFGLHKQNHDYLFPARGIVSIYPTYEAMASGKNMPIREGTKKIIKNIFQQWKRREATYGEIHTALKEILFFMENINVDQEEGWNADQAVQFQNAFYALLSIVLILKTVPNIVGYNTINFTKVYLDLYSTPLRRVVSFKDSNGAWISSATVAELSCTGQKFYAYDLVTNGMAVNVMFQNIVTDLIPVLKKHCEDTQEFYKNLMIYNKKEIPFRKILEKNIKIFLEKHGLLELKCFSA